MNRKQMKCRTLDYSRSSVITTDGGTRRCGRLSVTSSLINRLFRRGRPNNKKGDPIPLVQNKLLFKVAWKAIEQHSTHYTTQNNTSYRHHSGGEGGGYDWDLRAGAIPQGMEEAHPQVVEVILVEVAVAQWWWWEQ
ncbi:hypothetical protein FRC14_006666 [Serendipita sp. 396]|nr:hypothetical protein FRC14_006666 [Serendipita sp. 396]KAG8778660.1 hypothetical protein FRC15_010642 [Serendipita sp. 397]KAG8795695.1 hypothetical protein FRC16_009999 [Serendipita sp. 398]KAG8847336.1 hypothetical protein FRB91_011892 [Serendipita sp. 411]KAG8863940.1 hypothetical protein FRC20_010424 [Serendipita sp. 405]KAG9053514.1 hypothetical protein FS842_008075 [Serendipita sp. 407]